MVSYRAPTANLIKIFDNVYLKFDENGKVGYYFAQIAKKARKGFYVRWFLAEGDDPKKHTLGQSKYFLEICLLHLCNLVLVVVNLKIINTGIDKTKLIPTNDVLCIVQLSQVSNSKQFTMTQKELNRCVALGERDYDGKSLLFLHACLAFLFALYLITYLNTYIIFT